MVKPLNVPPVTVASPMFFTVALVKSPPVMVLPDRFSTVAPVKSPPVMVAPGMPDKPFFTVPVNLPPLMVAVFSTRPEMTPPEISPFRLEKLPSAKTVTSPDKLPEL